MGVGGGGRKRKKGGRSRKNVRKWEGREGEKWEREMEKKVKVKTGKME